MTSWKIVKLVLFLSALGWMAINVAGTFMAIASEGSTGHIAAHIGGAVFSGLVAWFVRPRRGQRTQAAAPEGDGRVAMLEAEVSALQRQLHETQRSLEFTEELLGKRAESGKDPSP